MEKKIFIILKIQIRSDLDDEKLVKYQQMILMNIC